MKCGNFGGYGGSGNYAIFLLTDWFICSNPQWRR